MSGMRHLRKSVLARWRACCRPLAVLRGHGRQLYAKRTCRERQNVVDEGFPFVAPMGRDTEGQIGLPACRRKSCRCASRLQSPRHCSRSCVKPFCNSVVRGIKRKRTVAIAALAAAAIGSNLAVAQAHKAKIDPRAMHAHSEWTFDGDRDCVPANGAQIRGGFAASDDLISVNTGEICGKQ